MPSAARTRAACDASVEEMASALRDQRRWAARHRDRINAEWDAIETPPRTIEQHLVTLSPERRAQIDEEWKSA